MTTPPPTASPWLWLAGIVIVSGVGWLLVRAQRRSLDAGSDATATTALSVLVEQAARGLFAELRLDLDRLRTELTASRGAEEALERRVDLLEAELLVVRRWADRLSAQVVGFGAEPVPFEPT